MKLELKKKSTHIAISYPFAPNHSRAFKMFRCALSDGTWVYMHHQMIYIQNGKASMDIFFVCVFFFCSARFTLSLQFYFVFFFFFFLFAWAQCMLLLLLLLIYKFFLSFLPILPLELSTNYYPRRQYSINAEPETSNDKNALVHQSQSIFPTCSFSHCVLMILILYFLLLSSALFSSWSWILSHLSHWLWPCAFNFCFVFYFIFILFPSLHLLFIFI